MEQKAKSVGIWIRVSTEDQAKGESPEHHEKRARGYAEFKGWNVKEVYHLEGVSGKSVMAHPEAQRMLKDIREGHISALIFSKLARLARNTKELLEFSDIFKEYNADLISLQEAIDTSSPAGRLFYTMIAAMAQWEREEISSRVAASIPIRAKLGKPIGGGSPFGYHWVDRKLVIDPNEAPIRKLMHELFLEHRRMKTVARILNEKGHRTRQGAKFTDTVIARLLRDPVSKGVYRRNYCTKSADGKVTEIKPEEEWIYIQLEPIISEEMWNKCYLILKERFLHEGKKPARKSVHLFSGYVRCPCGKKMYVPSNYPKYTCRSCDRRNKIPVTDLEDLFHEQLKRFLFSEKETAAYLESANKTLAEKEELLQTIEKEKAKVKEEIEGVFRLYHDNQIDTNGFGERHRPLKTRLDQLENQIPELQGEIDFMKIQFRSGSQILNEARNFYARWKDLSHEEKRRIVEDVLEEIIIDKDEVTIRLRNLLPPDEGIPPDSDPPKPDFNNDGGKRRNSSSDKITATGQHTPILSLPCCRITIKCPKPPGTYYPKIINTLGDHLRQKRLDTGLTQKELAEKLGVFSNSLLYWETNRKDPDAYLKPRIYDFLGYVPYNPVLPFCRKIVIWRESQGLSQRQLDKKLGLNGAVSHWERGGKIAKKHLKRLLEFFGMNGGKK